jgi:phage-related protein
MQIIDSDVTKALSDAAKAQDTADHKRRVFVTQPVPPYDLGDLWSQGVNGDLLVCTIAKATGQAFSLSDWNRASNSLQQGVLYNGVKIDTTDGVKVTRSDSKVQTFLNATTGIKIQKNTGTTLSPVWQDSFYVDSNGSLIAESLTANKLIVKNGANVNIDANTGTIDFSKFTTIAGKLSATNVDTTSLTVQSANVTGILTANQIDLKGTNLANFKIDASGNVTISGNLTMTGGSISWGNISAPSYSLITGTKPPTDAINSSQATTITQNYVSTATIKTSQLTSQGSNPIIKLFTGLSVTNSVDPAIDATQANEMKIGSQIRLKWNDYSYLSVQNEQANCYFSFRDAYGNITGSTSYITFDKTGINLNSGMSFKVNGVAITGGGGTAVFA